MFLRRKFSPGFSRAVNGLLRSLSGIRHATGIPPTTDAATTMEKLDAALNNVSHGLCMFGSDNRLLLWNDRYVKMYKLAPDRLRTLDAGRIVNVSYRPTQNVGFRPTRTSPSARKTRQGLRIWRAALPAQFIISSFDEAPGRFLACLPLRKRMSISVPLTRTSSHRR
jgi:PAS domain-containing protein